jgi:hypothetical protein
VKRITLISLILLMCGSGWDAVAKKLHQPDSSKQRNQRVYLKATVIASYISPLDGATGKGYTQMFTVWLGPQGSRMEFEDKVLLNLTQTEKEDISYTLYPADKTFELHTSGNASQMEIPLSPLFSGSKGLTKVRTDHYMGHKCDVMTGRFPVGLGMPHGLGVTETTSWFTTVRSHRLALRTMFSIFDSSGKLSRLFILDIVQLESHSKVPEGLFEVPDGYKMKGDNG